MRELLLLVSFLWVFPNAYQSLRIPFPNAVLIHGEPVGSITPPHREKRAEKDNVTVTCSSHDYKPRGQNHCCNKCLAGFRVAKDCMGNGQATQCVACESETYMDIPSKSKRCEACSVCLPQYGQIVLSECTAQKNTQCGCPSGYFKLKSGSEFLCQECSRCQNGTQARECHDDKDTICTCFYNFFLDQSGKTCRPCSECQGPDCKDHCPDTKPVKRPEENNGVILVVLGVILGVIIVALALYMAYAWYKGNRSSYSTGTSGQTEHMISHQDSEDQKHTLLPGYTYKEDNPYVMQQSTEQPMDGSLPLPDITQGTSCLNSPKVLYAIIESIPIGRWREFARLLGLSNHTIEASYQDHRYCRDAQYAMLQVWISQEGCLTTKRDQLFNVLRDINLGGCIEKIEKHL